MSKQIKPRPSHFNIYYHDNSLLFQFIVSNLIFATKRIRSMAQSVNSIKLMMLESPSQEQYFQIFHQLKSEMGELVNLSLLDKRKMMWNTQEGLLDKLKSHCELFLQKEPTEDKELSSLFNFASKLWLLCLKSLNIFQSLEKNSSDNQANSKTLFSLIEKMSTPTRRLGQTITKIAIRFREDENVMFFLLCHHLQLSELYGSRFVEKLFDKSYPKGAQEAGEFLRKKYLDRGFNQLLPTITSKIEELRPVQLS